MRQASIKIPTCTTIVTTNLTEEQEAFVEKRGMIHSSLRGTLTCTHDKKTNSLTGKQFTAMLIDNFGTRIRRSIDSLSSPALQQEYL